MFNASHTEERLLQCFPTLFELEKNVIPDVVAQDQPISLYKQTYYLRKCGMRVNSPFKHTRQSETKSKPLLFPATHTHMVE